MKFAPYALCQNTYLELPYKDWEMSAGKTECILRITGQANEIKVLIKEGTCQLIGPLVELHTSLQSPCSPSLFFKRLSHIGLNFFGPKSMNGFDVGDWVAKVFHLIGYHINNYYLSLPPFIKISIRKQKEVVLMELAVL